MNGKQQAEAMARLAGNQFKAGDLVDLPALGRCQVTGISASGKVTVLTANGQTILVPRQFLKKAVR